jgi:hypothetical protein
MTTGTTGTLGAWPYNYKNWQGSDGKYDTVNGVQRERWNAYTMNSDTTTAKKDSRYDFNYVTDHYAVSPLDWESNDTIKLLAKLASKVKDHDFHVGKFAVEGRQTVNLVTERLKTVGGALIDLKRGDFAYAARRLNVKNVTTKRPNYDLSGRWLELQYGWLPLIHDTFSAMQAYDRLTSKRRSGTLTAGTFRAQQKTEPPASPYNWEWRHATTLKQRIWYEWTEELSDSRSLGLEDPLGIIWEGLPWTFVIDWFIPISTYLDALNIIPQLKGRWMILKVKNRSGASGIVTDQANYGGCVSTRNQVWVERTVGTGFRALDIPLPNIKTLDAAASPEHVKNAIALLHQLVTKERASSKKQEQQLLNQIRPFYKSADLLRGGFLGNLSHF